MVHIHTMGENHVLKKETIEINSGFNISKSFLFYGNFFAFSNRDSCSCVNLQMVIQVS